MLPQPENAPNRHAAISYGKPSGLGVKDPLGEFLQESCWSVTYICPLFAAQPERLSAVELFGEWERKGWGMAFVLAVSLENILILAGCAC